MVLLVLERQGGNAQFLLHQKDTNNQKISSNTTQVRGIYKHQSAYGQHGIQGGGEGTIIYGGGNNMDGSTSNLANSVSSSIPPASPMIPSHGNTLSPFGTEATGGREPPDLSLL